MAEPVIKPAERTRINDALARCSACADNVRALELIGVDQTDRRRRMELAENMARGILEVDRRLQEERRS